MDIEVRVRALEDRMAEVEATQKSWAEASIKLFTLMRHIDQNVEKLREEFENRIDALDHRMGALENRIDALDHRMEGIEHNLKAIMTHLGIPGGA